MARQELATLLVEDDPSYVEFMVNVARGDANLRLNVTHAGSLAEALEIGDGQDVALLDFTLPDSHGLKATRALRDAVGCPILVLADEEDEEVASDTLRLGAEEYLVKQRTDPTLLLRAIRYAVERNRLTEELVTERRHAERERELRHMERLARSSTSVTAAAYGVGLLREREPQAWSDLLVEYRGILEQALRERAFRLDPTASQDLTSLADILGWHGATPRDVVELHTAGLKAELAANGPRVTQALVEEARILALELMGTVLSYYRARAALRLRDGEASRRATR